MDWKFWQRKDTAEGRDTGKNQKYAKLRELPYEVGRKLVVEKNFDPDWIWNLKCVIKPKDNSKSLFDIRIFDQQTMVQHGMKVRGFDSLDDHMNLVLFAGWYDKETRDVRVEQLTEEAV